MIIYLLWKKLSLVEWVECIVKIKYQIFFLKEIKLYRSWSCVQNFQSINRELPTQVEIICTLVYLISSLYHFVSFVMQFLNSIKSFYIYSLFESVKSIELKYIKKPKGLSTLPSFQIWFQNFCTMPPANKNSVDSQMCQILKKQSFYFPAWIY